MAAAQAQEPGSREPSAPIAARNPKQELDSSDLGARIGRTRSESGVRVGALGYFFSGWAGGVAATAKKRGGKGREMGDIRRCETGKMAGEIGRRSAGGRWPDT